LREQRAGRRAAPYRHRPVEPLLPPDTDAEELPPEIRAELRSLPKTLAERVAGHLVAAGRLVDDDPATAHLHAAYARAVAPRLAAAREAAGVTAYLVGDYAEALAELRAWRRMTGRPDHLPVMADSERGLGRPERALELTRDPDAARLDAAGRAELLIVESGARRDLGEYETAVAVLRGPELDANNVQPWTVRLWYAYADALLAAGRRDEARAWFEATAELDLDETTDARQRVTDLGDEPA
jgi:tetratricopeptide (TPR) repeat protein